MRSERGEVGLDWWSESLGALLMRWPVVCGHHLVEQLLQVILWYMHVDTCISIKEQLWVHILIARADSGDK